MEYPQIKEILPFQPYLLLGFQFTNVNKIASYYLFKYVVIKINDIRKQLQQKGQDVTEITQFLGQLMDALEEETKELGPQLKDRQSNQEQVSQFALKLFFKCDNQDREGDYDKNLVQNFLAASRCIESLSQFETLSQDLEQKRIYAKSKAVEIAKLLKNPEALNKKIQEIQSQKQQQINPNDMNEIEKWQQQYQQDPIEQQKYIKENQPQIYNNPNNQQISSLQSNQSSNNFNLPQQNLNQSQSKPSGLSVIKAREEAKKHLQQAINQIKADRALQSRDELMLALQILNQITH